MYRKLSAHYLQFVNRKVCGTRAETRVDVFTNESVQYEKLSTSCSAMLSERFLGFRQDLIYHKSAHFGFVTHGLEVRGSIVITAVRLFLKFFSMLTNVTWPFVVVR